MGPGFDPDRDIEDWSDDDDDESCSDSMSPRGKTDDEILAELGLGPEPLGFGRLGGGDGGFGNFAPMPLRRTQAAIYMPIRVNCLYG